MTDRLPMPSAMPAEIAEKLSDVSQHPEPFDEYMDEHLSWLVPGELIAPLQRLLITLREIQMVERIDCLDKAKALEWLRRDASAIREACAKVWRDCDWRDL